jgi:hypothetical protein
MKLSKSLGSKKNFLLRQVTSYEIFYNGTRKKLFFNARDCLIEVTSWAGLTVLSYILNAKRYNVSAVYFLCVDNNR